MGGIGSGYYPRRPKRGRYNKFTPVCINGHNRSGNVNHNWECLTCKQARNAEKRREARRIVMARYGGKCVCCGETEDTFLTLDHKNHDGYKDRANHGLVWFHVIRKGFPVTFQILCFNCNCGREINGGICPHRTRERIRSAIHRKEEVQIVKITDDGQGRLL